MQSLDVLIIKRSAGVKGEREEKDDIDILLYMKERKEILLIEKKVLYMKKIEEFSFEIIRKYRNMISSPPLSHQQYSLTVDLFYLFLFSISLYKESA